MQLGRKGVTVVLAALVSLSLMAFWGIVPEVDAQEQREESGTVAFPIPTADTSRAEEFCAQQVALRYIKAGVDTPRELSVLELSGRPAEILKAHVEEQERLRIEEARKARERATKTTVTRISYATRTYNTSGVEQWRSLVQKYFGANTDAALSVMRKESGGNPNAHNRSSGASGLFQQMPQYWEARITRAEEVYGRGFSHNIFDPEANIAASAVLSSGGSNWSHWVAKP